MVFCITSLGQKVVGCPGGELVVVGAEKWVFALLMMYAASWRWQLAKEATDKCNDVMLQR